MSKSYNHNDAPPMFFDGPITTFADKETEWVINKPEWLLKRTPEERAIESAKVAYSYFCKECMDKGMINKRWIRCNGNNENDLMRCGLCGHKKKFNIMICDSSTMERDATDFVRFL